MHSNRYVHTVHTHMRSYVHMEHTRTPAHTCHTPHITSRNVTHTSHTRRRTRHTRHNNKGHTCTSYTHTSHHTSHITPRNLTSHHRQPTSALQQRTIQSSALTNQPRADSPSPPSSGAEPQSHQTWGASQHLLRWRGHASHLTPYSGQPWQPITRGATILPPEYGHRDTRYRNRAAPARRATTPASIANAWSTQRAGAGCLRVELPSTSSEAPASQFPAKNQPAQNSMSDSPVLPPSPSASQYRSASLWVGDLHPDVTEVSFFGWRDLCCCNMVRPRECGDGRVPMASQTASGCVSPGLALPPPCPGPFFALSTPPLPFLCPSHTTGALVHQVFCHRACGVHQGVQGPGGCCLCKTNRRR